MSCSISKTQHLTRIQIMHFRTTQQMSKINVLEDQLFVVKFTHWYLSSEREHKCQCQIFHPYQILSISYCLWPSKKAWLNLSFNLTIKPNLSWKATKTCQLFFPLFKKHTTLWIIQKIAFSNNSDANSIAISCSCMSVIKYKLWYYTQDHVPSI